MPIGLDIPQPLNDKLKRELNRLIKAMHAGTEMETDSKLIAAVGEALEQQVFKGYGFNFENIDWTTPDALMLKKLTSDVWHFSAAKNYQELKDITQALRDEKGNLRNFDDFKEAALKIGETHVNWLKTEYNMAIGSSTMAARWTDFEKNAEDMPFLQYSTVGDNNVRDEHARLNGIIRRIADEFWRTHYPPNGWGCRCSVNQLASGTAVESDTIPQVPIPEMFRTNLAQQGLIFPKGHAYYNGIPNGVLNNAVATLPDNVAFKRLYTNEDLHGYVDLHILHGAEEMKPNFEISKFLADQGHKIKLLPILKESDDNLRKIIYGTDKFLPGKNPDSLIGKKLFELTDLKNPNIKNLGDKIRIKAMRLEKKQADNVVINLINPMNEAEIERVVKGKINISKSIDEIWIINNGKLLKWQNPNYAK